MKIPEYNEQYHIFVQISMKNKSIITVTDIINYELNFSQAIDLSA